MRKEGWMVCRGIIVTKLYPFRKVFNEHSKHVTKFNIEQYQLSIISNSNATLPPLIKAYNINLYNSCFQELEQFLTHQEKATWNNKVLAYNGYDKCLAVK